MNPIPINVAVEDRLSEEVLRCLLAHVNRGYTIGAAYGRGGYGYLKRTVRGWNYAAAGKPFAVLTDLDTNYECPRALIDDWLPVSQHPNLLFRVAVREIEAWLLADRVNMAEFLGVPLKLVPGDVEALDDPKQALIELARRSRNREIRARLVPRSGSTARQGPDHNGCLSGFVWGDWDVEEASRESSSLLRALQKLRSFTPTWPPK